MNTLAQNASIEVFPVVHVIDEQRAREQTDLALQLGADGVYLISHGRMNADGLTDVFNSVVEDHPDAFVGINYLDLGSGVAAFDYLDKAQKQGRLNRLPNAVWADNIEGFRGDDVNKLMRVRTANPELQSVNFLGGIAFKYTAEYTDDPEKAAEDVRKRGSSVSVITTSGQGTGLAPSPEKIAAVKQAAGEKPVAIASGVDIDNIEVYRGNVDQILVASSVETEPYSGIFDPVKLKVLIDTAHLE